MKFRTGYYYTPYSSLGEAMGGSGGGGGGRAGKRKQVGRATLVFLIGEFRFVLRDKDILRSEKDSSESIIARARAIFHTGGGGAS